jgi:hypothetical protein
MKSIFTISIWWGHVNQFDEYFILTSAGYFYKVGMFFHCKWRCTMPASTDQDCPYFGHDVYGPQLVNKNDTRCGILGGIDPKPHLCPACVDGNPPHISKCPHGAVPVFVLMQQREFVVIVPVC